MATAPRWSFLVVLAVCAASLARAQQPAQPSTPDPWPKSATQNGTKYTIYQPQLDSWDNYQYRAHAAVSVQKTGSKAVTFGVIEISATTVVDKQASVVHIENLSITKATFPSAPQRAAAYQQAIQQLITQGTARMSLGRLEAALAIEGAERKSVRVPVLNEPPRIVFSEKAAVMVLLQGAPVWRPVEGTNFQRVINARALVLSDPSGNVYLHVLDGFMAAPSLNGPWNISGYLPPGMAALAQTLAQQGVVDLMEGPVNQTTGQPPSLSSGAPAVVVATQPTEIVITEGPLNWVPIEGTQLLYVANTSSNVFEDLTNQQIYVLVTGRWFRAPALTGPWSFVRGRDLPPDFARIPDTSPKENVKASVPGTAQAQEAAIAASIPQMAIVYRDKVSFQAVVTGPPILQPIPGTSLFYVFNSPQPIIQVTPTQWYAVQSGVWFAAGALAGPWFVAESVPAVLYSIPPSAALYYLTYVQIYAVTPTTVTVGYTPGYMGVVVEPDGTVVYGTGYTYVAYVGTTVYYPPPVTYGYAANPTYTPAAGFAVGFAVGFGIAAACYAPAPYWGPMPYAYHGAAYGAYGGKAVWGASGWAATTGNVYHQYGATSAVTHDTAGYNAYTGNAYNQKTGTSYNSVTGRSSAGQSTTQANAYTGNYSNTKSGATYNPNTGTTASGSKTTTGNAYTGQQNTTGHADVSGPGGQSTQVAEHNNEYYGDHDGNVYNYNSSTGQAQKQNANGSWSNVDKSTASSNSSYDKPPSSSSYQASSQARSYGDSKSSSSAWGGGDASDHSSGGGSADHGSWGGFRGGGGGGGFRR